MTFGSWLPDRALVIPATCNTAMNGTIIAILSDMSNTMSNKGFTVGSMVVLTEEYVSLFESFDLRNVLCEVVDARRAFGEYVYNVAPIGNRSRVVEVYASDLRAPNGFIER